MDQVSLVLAVVELVEELLLVLLVEALVSVLLLVEVLLALLSLLVSDGLELSLLPASLLLPAPSLSVAWLLPFAPDLRA
jgi:hypothetical protein